VPLDITDSDGLARLALALNERYRRLDILVGNAGVAGPLRHLACRAEGLERGHGGECDANWQLIRCLDALLRQASGRRAVFVTSASARKAPAYRGPYAASKAALEALARSYAAETANTPVRVNVFDPGRSARACARW